MLSESDIHAAVIARSRRVPRTGGTPGDGRAAARQVDVTLMSAGFKLSAEALAYLGGLHPDNVHRTGFAIVAAARKLVGAHVDHNVYFRDFPRGVPDTEAFWAELIEKGLAGEPAQAKNLWQQLTRGFVNLLDLPGYGKYQTSYEEMLARHDDYLAALGDRVTELRLGGTLEDESLALYLELAGSEIPLFPSDLPLLAALAERHVADAQPDRIGVRENRAVVNATRVRHGLEPDVDTVVDVLRLACALSDGDVTLTEPTRFRSFARSERRRLLAALDGVITANPAKLADVNRYAERFKRLSERLHPHDYPRYSRAAEVFAVARGEIHAPTIDTRAQLAIADGEPAAALEILAAAPGILLRTTDQLARAGADPAALRAAVEQAADSAAPHVVLSLRDHLLSRSPGPPPSRVFVNQRGRAWVQWDDRPPLAPGLVADLARTLDDTILGWLPEHPQLVVDPDVRRIALPLSDKSRPGGLGILPRGSVQPAAGHVRFFLYWRERADTTDYDLSALLLDEHFREAGQVSYTNLREHGMVHSGDITESPNGASEFIDVDLTTVQATYLVPEVNVYAGERFDRAAEAFFGFMERRPEQRGAPFEPRAVRTKSDLYGTGRVALPLVFARRDDGAGWEARWMHLSLSGRLNFNRVEGSARTASRLVRATVERDALTFGHLEALLLARGSRPVELLELDPRAPITYLGFDEPGGLPAGSTVVTPASFWAAIA